jgi:hypothetical protein
MIIPERPDESPMRTGRAAVRAGRREHYGGGVYDGTTWAAPAPRRPRSAGRITAIVIGALLLACCAGTGTAIVVTGMLQDQQQAQGTEPQGGIVPRDVSAGDGGGTAEPEAPAIPGLGDPVRDGQFEFTVSGVTCGHESVGEQWWKREAQGEFCIVEMSVRNIGTDARHFADGAQKAKGPEGNRYAADTGAGVVVNGNGDAVWNVVNPGNAIDAKIVFDVPPGATLASLELHDSHLSGGVIVQVY